MIERTGKKHNFTKISGKWKDGIYCVGCQEPTAHLVSPQREQCQFCGAQTWYPNAQGKEKDMILEPDPRITNLFNKSYSLEESKKTRKLREKEWNKNLIRVRKTQK